jgi:hypothetical protein
MALQDDIAWYEQNRAFIAQQYEGQWLVIKDQGVRGAFPTQEAAYQASIAMYGTAGALVKQASREEPTVII